MRLVYTYTVRVPCHASLSALIFLPLVAMGATMNNDSAGDTAEMEMYWEQLDTVGV